MTSAYPMLVVVGLCLLGVRAYPEGAPAEACPNLEPLHPDESNPPNNYPAYTEIDIGATDPFQLTLSVSSVKQGESLTVSVTSEGNATFYEGFFLVAVKKGDIATRIGRFADAPTDADWQNGPCQSTEDGQKMASMTHNSKAKKYEHSLEWIADTAMTGDFCIQGAMVHETEQWYKLDGSDDTHCFTVTEGDGMDKDGDEETDGQGDKMEGDKEGQGANNEKGGSAASGLLASAVTLTLCVFSQLV